MVKSIRVISLIGAIGFLAPLALCAQTFQFTQPLKPGVSSQEVYELQVVLNRNVKTRVAETGPGSPGEESFYYGSRTFSAVIKFQQLYGITPLGIVGPMTRAKLNALPAPSGELKVIGSPRITNISPTTGSYSTTVTIHGSGFTPTGNTVHTGFDTLILPSSDGQTISVPIGSPAVPRYNGDRHDVIWDLWIFVENQNGQSDVAIFKFNPNP